VGRHRADPARPARRHLELQRLPERRLASDTGDRFLRSDRPEPAWNTKGRSKTVPTGERCSPQPDRLRGRTDIRLGQDGTCRTGQRRRSQCGTTRGVVPEWIITLAGTVLVLFSAFCFGAAVWREIDTAAGPPHSEIWRLPRLLLIVVNLRLGLVSISGAGRNLVRSHTVASAKSNSILNS
jgi:hypothetical protein